MRTLAHRLVCKFPLLRKLESVRLNMPQLCIVCNEIFADEFQVQNGNFPPRDPVSADWLTYKVLDQAAWTIPRTIPQAPYMYP